MTWGNHGDERFGDEQAVVEAGRDALGAQAHQREVEFRGEDGREQRLAGPVGDGQFDAGMPSAVVAEDGGQVDGAGHGLDEAEAQPAAAQPGERVEVLLGLLGVGEQPPRPGQQDGAGLGQPHLARRAAEQGGADVRLQPGDLLAEGGLRDSALRGGLGEAQRLGDGGEIAEVA